jgi:hypothetical protein
MRERDREIKRRRQRYEKRKRLRKQLASAKTDSEKQVIQERIYKTQPQRRAVG